MALPTLEDLKTQLTTAPSDQIAGLQGSIAMLEQRQPTMSSVAPPPTTPTPGVVSSDLAKQTFSNFEKQLTAMQSDRDAEKAQELIDRQASAEAEAAQSKNLLAGREQEIEAGAASDIEAQRLLSAQQQRAAEILFGKAGALFTTTAATTDLASQARQATLEERQILRNKDRLLGEARQAAADRDITRLKSLREDIRTINKDAREAKEKAFTLGLQLESAKINEARNTLDQAQETRLSKQAELTRLESIRDIADKLPVGETMTLEDGTVIRGAKTKKIAEKEYFVSEVKEPDGSVYKIGIDKSDPSKVAFKTFLTKERPVGGSGDSTTAKNLKETQRDLDYIALQAAVAGTNVKKGEDPFASIPDWAKPYLIAEIKDGDPTGNYKTKTLTEADLEEIKGVELRGTEELKENLKDVNFVVKQIKDDRAQGVGYDDIRESALGSGITPEIYRQALQLILNSGG